MTVARVLHPSMAEQWDDCQEMARVAMALPYDIAASQAAETGRAFHAMAAEYLRTGSVELSEEALLRYPTANAGEARGIFRSWQLDKEQMAFLAGATDLRVEATLEAVPRAGWLVSGTVDAMWREADAIVVRDWKTHWSVRALAEPKSNAQLRLYAYLAANAYTGDDRPDLVVSHCFVRHRGDGAVYRYVLTWDEALHGGQELAVRTIAQIEAAEQTGRWLARPGARCGWCFAAPRCSVNGAALMALGGTDTGDLVAQDPQRAADLYHALGTVHGLLKERLQAHVELHGPIQVGDQTLGFHERTAVVYDDLAQVGRVLKAEMGAERAWEAFSASRTSVSKAMKGMDRKARARVWGQLDELADERTTTAFGWKRTAKGEEEDGDGE